MTVEEGKVLAKDGLPATAFAVVGDPQDPQTWLLPHHTRAIARRRRGRRDIEATVDWEAADTAAASLSPRHRGERRAAGDSGVVIAAARHLAEHYRRAGRPLPDVLAALI